MGFIVPRYKHSAVDRNRLKRRLREIARTRLLPGLPPVDFVIRALPHAYAATFDALGSQLDRSRDRIARAATAGAPPRRQPDAAPPAPRDQSAAPGTEPPHPPEDA